MRFGIDMRFNFVNYGQRGTPSSESNFERMMTQGPDSRTSTANAGVGYPSVLLGAGGNGVAGPGGNSISRQIRPASGKRYHAAHIEDDCKLSRKITVNAGFRWDFEGGVTQRYNQLAAINPYVNNSVVNTLGMDLTDRCLFAIDSLGIRGIRNASPSRSTPEPVLFTS